MAEHEGIGRQDWQWWANTGLKGSQNRFSLLLGCLEHRDRRRVSRCSPLRAEPPADFAMNDRVAQVSLRTVVVKRYVGPVQEDEQTGTMFAVTPLLIASPLGSDWLIEQRIASSLDGCYLPLVVRRRQGISMFAQSLGSQEELLQAIGEGTPVGINGVLQVAQLVGDADLVLLSGVLQLR